MKIVAKYNTYKGISTALTVGTPIVTLCCCSDFFVHRSDTAISAAGIFALLIAALFAKDKLIEHFKMPSAFIVATAMLVLIVMIESIIEPLKYVCVATMITSGIDEVSFKRFYKNIELQFPDNHTMHKVAGFMVTTSKKLLGGTDGE